MHSAVCFFLYLLYLIWYFWAVRAAVPIGGDQVAAVRHHTDIHSDTHKATHGCTDTGPFPLSWLLSLISHVPTFPGLLPATKGGQFLFGS